MLTTVLTILPSIREDKYFWFCHLTGWFCHFLWFFCYYNFFFYSFLWFLRDLIFFLSARLRTLYSDKDPNEYDSSHVFSNRPVRAPNFSFVSDFWVFFSRRRRKSELKKKEKKEVFEICDSSYLEIQLSDWFLSRSVLPEKKNAPRKGKGKIF